VYAEARGEIEQHLPLRFDNDPPSEGFRVLPFSEIPRFTGGTTGERAAADKKRRDDQARASRSPVTHQAPRRSAHRPSFPYEPL
jgi:hypothetical protein